MHCNQQTLTRPYIFEGKGLHTGQVAKMTLLPAPVGTGILFRRTDLGGAAVAAVAENVSSTARSTTLSSGEASVSTVEHVLSALTGLGVDNAFIDLDNIEVPILDGSARRYAEAVCADGLADQGVPRRYFDLSGTVEVHDEASGSYVRLEPAGRPSFDVTIDFGSDVLGVQSAHWDEAVDYASEIAGCRTFVFFHELEFLYRKGLVQGGDVENAIVIVEHPVTDDQLATLCRLFNVPRLQVRAGYLDNLRLRFPNECGRHKLLDLIGDIRLIGGYLNARVTAYKPGHTINTAAAKAVRQLLK